MAYTKTTWVDRVVQYPTKYTASGAVTGDITLTANPGTITQAGTPVNASNLNNIENAIFNLDAKVNYTRTWNNFTMQNSWLSYGSPYATAGYIKTGDDYVELRGAVKSGTSGTYAFTLPSGYRPLTDLIIPIVSNGSTTPANINIIASSGLCYINSGSANTLVSLGGVRFPLF